MEDLPTSKIRSAAQGTVELKGIAKSLPTHPLIGKLTQKPCAWYYYTIEEILNTREGVASDAYWNVCERGVSDLPFLLNDETGDCVILPKGAEIVPSGMIAWRGHTRIPSPPPTSFFIWLFWVYLHGHLMSPGG